MTAVKLHGVPWRSYLDLRNSPETGRQPMTYDRGELEIISLTWRHQRFVSVLGRLIDIWTEEQEIESASCGSMTMQREDLQRGFEPDRCYYIARAPLVRAKEELNFTTDPPPDLAIEVDVMQRTIEKAPLYAAFGVPELWRYDGRQLHVFSLHGEQYRRATHSQSLPNFPVAEAEAVLAKLGTASDTQLAREFRKWVHSNR